jgi:hypothetical protein
MYSSPCQPRANSTVWTGQRTETNAAKRASWPASPRSNYKQQVWPRLNLLNWAQIGFKGPVAKSLLSCSSSAKHSSLLENSLNGFAPS